MLSTSYSYDIEAPMALDVYIGVAKSIIASTVPKVRAYFMKFRMDFQCVKW